jgi:hypothetical protein
MSIDLRLLPCEHWHVQQDGSLWGHSHTILDLGGVSHETHDAFEELVKPHLVKMPEGHHISSYVGARVSDGFHKGETTYGTIRDKDAYGTPYEVVEAQHLLPWLAEHFQYDGHLGHGPYQAAIVAYVRALPPATKIVLDWH